MDKYHSYALAASNAEKLERYKDAAYYWSKAALFSNNIDNREWAIRRRSFCLMRLKYRGLLGY
jgi:hypothetical protein